MTLTNRFFAGARNDKTGRFQLSGLMEREDDICGLRFDQPCFTEHGSTVRAHFHRTGPGRLRPVPGRPSAHGYRRLDAECPADVHRLYAPAIHLLCGLLLLHTGHLGRIVCKVRKFLTFAVDNKLIYDKSLANLKLLLYLHQSWLHFIIEAEN